MIFLFLENILAELDQEMKGALNQSTSKVNFIKDFSTKVIL